MENFSGYFPGPANVNSMKYAVHPFSGFGTLVTPFSITKVCSTEYQGPSTSAAGARWYSLVFGNAVHAYTIPGVNAPPVAKYDEPATRHGYTLAHAFIADAFAGKL